MNKILVITLLLAMLTPALLVGSVPMDETTVVPEDWDSSVGVVAGDVYYYDFDQLAYPTGLIPDNITMPDLTDNLQIFVKVMYVDNAYEFNSTITGTYVYFAVGLQFTKDTTFGIDLTDPLLQTDIVIPAGAATPSAAIAGKPHFQDDFGGPIVWALNDDWAEHQAFMESMGFTVTNGASEFSVSVTNGTGTISGTWRKSDGALTNILFDDIIFGDMNLTDFTFELSLDRVESHPLTVSVGDTWELQLDTMDLEITGTGDIYDDINQTAYSEIQSTMSDLEGTILESMVVTQVYGCYYVCNFQLYNFDTETLEVMGDVYFNGFFGSIQNVEPPKYYDSGADTFNPSGIAPYLTPDWDLYEGYMILGNTILGVYINELLDIAGPPADEFIINEASMTFGFEKKRDYYYFTQAADMDMEINMTSSISPLVPEQSYDTGMMMTMDEDMYLAYHQSGEAAAINMIMDINVEIYDDTGSTAVPTGTLNINFNLKVKNPEYNPPDIIGGGFIPGFEWFIAIPALAGVAAVGLLTRRRKK